MNFPFPHRCWTEIDLPNLTENVRRIRQHLPSGIRYISVVKADSYGLGARRTVPALRAGGADIFAVANIAEAAEIRETNTNVPILLLSATTPAEDPYLWQLNLIPTVSTPDEARRYQNLAERLGPLAIHVKIDTGMGRLGIWHEQVEKLAAALVASPALKIAGFYSHFATADQNLEFTAEQRRRFRHALQRFASRREPGQLIHIDNSSGLATFLGETETSAQFPWNAIRVGLLQYGVLPAADSALQKFAPEPVLNWHAKISIVKTLPAGATVGYGQTRRLDRETRVAVVAAGYADGISRACSNRASLLVQGRRCPVLGTITMDEIMIDVTEVTTHSGDTATLIGQQGKDRITINEFSDWSRTIPWEVMCAISKRVPRTYR